MSLSGQQTKIRPTKTQNGVKQINVNAIYDSMFNENRKLSNVMELSAKSRVMK
jgi:hypothetical protein